MNELKEIQDLEKAIKAFENLIKKDPNTVRGLEQRLQQLAKDIIELTK
ncbi:hypothetical protein [Paenibacillus agri]|uniref:Uncharacterized protein n=1 Tax=Paenibacillus agri TaxID=2744309 RepID=A0A850EYZ9_9BACL|nr:hypothetical protein [Paenibacillus agri]NUU63061.1 hypothetical protein [Paenibacillus agri]